MKKSTIKLDKEGYNDLAPLNEVMAKLKKYCPKYKVVDDDEDYWQNDEATLVLAFDKGLAFSEGLRVGELANNLSADEFNHFVEGEKVVVRLWWD